MKNNENAIKQIIYRSTHRGTKEMDLLLGGFVKNNITKFNVIDLKNLQQLLSIEDEIIYKWYFENVSNDKILDNKVSKLLKNFRL